MKTGEKTKPTHFLTLLGQKDFTFAMTMFCLAKTFCSPICSLETKPFRHLQKSQSDVCAPSNFISGKVPASDTRKKCRVQKQHVSPHSLQPPRAAEPQRFCYCAQQ